MVLNQILNNLDRDAKTKALIIVFLTIMTAAVEFSFLTAIVPFMAFLSGGGTTFNNRLSESFDLFGIQIVEFGALAMLLVGASLLAGILKTALLKLTIDTSFSVVEKWSNTMFKNLTFSRYQDTLKMSSSDFVAAICQKTQTVATYVLIPIINIFSSVLVGSLILWTMLKINFDATVSLIAIIGCIYVTLTFIVNPILHRQGGIFNDSLESKVDLSTHSILNIKEVLFNNNQEMLIKEFSSNEYLLRRSQSLSQFLGLFPRSVIEAVGLSLFFGIMAYFVNDNNSGAAQGLGSMVAIGFGAQKLLPIIQTIYNGVAALRFGASPLVDVVKWLDLARFEYDRAEDVVFTKAVTLEKVFFSYEVGGALAVNDIDLVINRNQKVVIVGSSGSGKSTLIDIVTGLLWPSRGKVIIDDQVMRSSMLKSWFDTIAYVPQRAHVFSGTLCENITGKENFVSDEDRGKFMDICQHLNLDSLNALEPTSEGLGGIYIQENGKSLSGGECQRIGIARALFKGRDILILDEATSALDSFNESAVLDYIMGLEDKTILMITHSTKHLDYFNKVYRMDSGSLADISGLRQGV